MLRNEWVYPTVSLRGSTDSALVKYILRRRGYTTRKQQESFLEPDYEKDMHDPYLLSDMEKAVGLLFDAIQHNKTVAIYGDYDADGVCASVVLHDTFKALGAQNILIYIPHREEEGYGMNIPALQRLKDKGVDVVVTVDLGSTNIKEVEWLRENNIVSIVTDHHIVRATHPKADAFINPHKEKEPYPFPYLCGAGVAFKLAVALLQYFRKHNKKAPPVGWEKWLLDIVAIATITDVMPLLDENRVIVRYGLLVLAQTRRYGLRALFEQCNIQPEYNRETRTTNLVSSMLGFRIGPRINAAGRMMHADSALQALLAKTPQEARRLAAVLEKANNQRKDAVNGIVKTIQGRSEKIRESNAVVMGDSDWAIGVVGIVAGKMAEFHRKPAFIYQKKGSSCVGSVRVPPHFNAVEILEEAGDVLEKFGGHKQAGGFSFSQENEQAFYEQIQKSVREAQKNKKATPSLSIDAVVKEGSVSVSLCEAISELEPFGERNTEPVLCLQGVQVESIAAIGADEKHIRCVLRYGSSNFKAIGFGLASDALQYMNEGDTVDVAFHLRKEEYQGVENVVLHIVDVA